MPADIKSSQTQIAQCTLDETNQSVKVSVVSASGAGGIATEVTTLRVAVATESINTKTPASPATAGNQATEIASLASIDGKTPALGQQLAAASSPVVLTAAQVVTLTPFAGGLTDTQLRAVAVPVSAASLPLPTGASTETTLAALNTKVPAQGQALAAASTPVVLTAAQITTLTPFAGGLTDTQLRTSAVPVSLASSPLPTGAATETTLAALNTKVTAVNTGAVVVSSSALPTGAATQTTLAAIDTKIPALGQALAAVSTPVVLTAIQITTLTPQIDSLTNTQLRASAVPVSISSSALPTGAATETTLAALSAKFGSQTDSGFGVPSANTQRVAAQIANLSGQIGGANPLQVDIGTNSYGTSVAASQKTFTTSGGMPVLATQSLMMGFSVNTSTHRELLVDSQGNLATSVGSINSARITSATVNPYIIDMLSTPIGTTFVQVVLSTVGAINSIQVQNQGSTPILIAVGAAASEIVQYIAAAGHDSAVIPLFIPAGSRIAIRSQTGTISANYFIINAFAS